MKHPTRQNRFHLSTFLACAAGLIGLIGCPDKSAPPTSESNNEATSAGSPTPKTLVIYSGRKESLVGPLLEKLDAQLDGVDVSVKYGKTSALAATLLEEQAAGAVSADIFFAQDAGALGLLAEKGLLAPLPETTLEKVAPAFRSPKGLWVGVSGRARTVVYSPARVKALPESLDDFADPKWKGRLGWAPTNASFQAHVTALRVIKGEDGAKAWLEAIQANEPKVYPKNTPIVEAVGRGEIDAGFVNHYYLHALQAKGVAKDAKNAYIDAVVNVAGVSILDGKSSDAALAFIDALLSENAQAYFADKTFEYPLTKGATVAAELTPLADIAQPKIDLSRLADLEGTLKLLRDTKVLH